MVKVTAPSYLAHDNDSCRPDSQHATADVCIKIGGTHTQCQSGPDLKGMQGQVHAKKGLSDVLQHALHVKSEYSLTPPSSLACSRFGIGGANDLLFTAIT